MSEISVEVAFAMPKKQVIVPLKVPAGTTMLQAVEMSKIGEQFPDFDVCNMPMGIFEKAQPKPAETVLNAGDRVCIFRPLIIDPKDNRKERAAKAKARKQQGE